MEHRPPAGWRVPWWSLVVLGLLIVLVGGYLLSHFIRIGPHVAIAYVWSGGLVVIGSVSQPSASGFSEKEYTPTTE